jgi:hypothetical protein
MALLMNMLASGLERDWLVSEGGTYPNDARESGERFARVVVSWFASAQAAGVPCATAQARESGLASTAASALQVGSPEGAGASLALAVAGYVAGQVFGPGVASFPAALGAAGAQIGAVFANLEATQPQRAQDIAGACALLAATTIVVFPAPMPPAPIT